MSESTSFDRGANIKPGDFPPPKEHKRAMLEDFGCALRERLAPHLASPADVRRLALEEAALIELEFWCETRTEDPVTFSVPAVLAAKGGE